MSELKIIPIDVLHEHPDNPRKEIGDVTELAESIKAQGVLQPLTVVPYWSKVHNRFMDGLYTIIIGHRRFNAAKLAGLKELPCIVSDMTEKEQISTMLTENMQRSDLTIYEEAKGFQMMIDLGSTPEEIAKTSGFSETTVRRRLSLAKLPEKAFKKAVERGATLYDFAELDKIEDTALRDEVLATLGTKDFKNRLSAAVETEKGRKLVAAWAEQAAKFATLLDDVDWKGGDRIGHVDGKEVRLDYVRNWNRWSKDKEVVARPENSDAEDEYFYDRKDTEICLYKKHRRDLVAEREARERAEKQDAARKRKDQLQEITDRHRALRLEFVKKFNSFQKKDVNVWEFVTEAMVYAKRNGGGWSNNESVKDLGKMLDVSIEDGKLNYQEFLSRKLEKPEQTALITAMWILDAYAYYEQRWDNDAGVYRCVYRNNEQLDMLYRLLSALGYVQSTEEVEMRGGTHKLFETMDAE